MYKYNLGVELNWEDVNQINDKLDFCGCSIIRVDCEKVVGGFGERTKGIILCEFPISSVEDYNSTQKMLLETYMEVLRDRIDARHFALEMCDCDNF